MPYIYGKAIMQNYIYMDGRATASRTMGLNFFDNHRISQQEIRDAFPKKKVESEIHRVKIFKTELQLLNYLRANHNEDDKQQIIKRKEKYPDETTHKGIYDFTTFLRPIFEVDIELNENEPEPQLEWQKEKIKFTMKHEDGGTSKSSNYLPMNIECEIEWVEIDVCLLSWKSAKLINYNQVTFNCPTITNTSPEISYAESFANKIGMAL